MFLGVGWIEMYEQAGGIKAGDVTAQCEAVPKSRTRIRTGAGRTSPRVLGYRESQVLALVRERIATVGMAPSYSEICDALGLSTREKVRVIVRQLERRGLLMRVGGGKVPRTVHCAKIRRIMLGVQS